MLSLMQAGNFTPTKGYFKKPVTYRMGWTRSVSHLICLAACAKAPVMGRGGMPKQ